mgnify:CR=1 FL=1
MKSAALEAAGSSSRGSGRALSGLASSLERQAAQSRQARPEEAHEPSRGTAEVSTLTMLRRSHSIHMPFSNRNVTWSAFGVIVCAA